jgi:hypothetical protein
MAFNPMLGAQPSSAEDEGYRQFEIIAERNIFNPNRSARAAVEPRADPAPSVRTESIALLGTLISKQKRLAFFDGSNSQYQKVLKPADTIAGYIVAEISWDQVTLQNGDHRIHLQVGTQLKREGEGDWTQNGRANPSRTRMTSAPAETDASGGEDKATESKEEVDDVLKRLMQKRAQELNP